MKAKIYHNPRCSKSRATLAILEENKVDFEVVNYLDAPPTKIEFKLLLSDLEMSARELLRNGEAAYKEQNLVDKTFSDDFLIDAMIKSPILIERPIVRTNNGVIIGRPPENVLKIL